MWLIMLRVIVTLHAVTALFYHANKDFTLTTVYLLWAIFTQQLLLLRKE